MIFNMNPILSKVRYYLLTLSAGLFLAGCQSNSEEMAEARPKLIEGYDDLKFGMSFEDAITLTGVNLFNPIGINSCLIDRPVRGCLLNPIDNFTPYRTIEGVPYGLGLSFNKFDKLTDISLIFTRRVIDSPEEKITAKECLEVYERTVDWVVKQYGLFDPPSAENQKVVSNAKTAAGVAYVIYHSSPSTFLADNSKVSSNARSIRVFSFFQPDSCDISVTWQEAENVERWSLPPETQSKFEKIIKEAS